MKLKTLAVAALSGLVLALPATMAEATKVKGEVTNFDFSFQGLTGTYDRNQLQRGLQVYHEACSSCHGLEYVAFRTLSDPNGPELPEDQMRAFADMYEIWDAELRDWRPAEGPDHFPESQFEGAPDLSLMTKARAGFSGPYGLGINQLMKGIGGPEYVASFLLGYTGEDDFQAGAMFYENTAYGGWVSMAPVLFDDMIEYADGTEATEEQMALDVAAFLAWTAEPKLVERKRAGFVGVIFLSVLATLLYLSNKAIWAPIKRAAKEDK